MQCDAVFAYARMDAAKTDPKLRQRAIDDVKHWADGSLHYAAGNAFNVTQREQGRPMFTGFFSTAGGTELVRAYYLTGDRNYLKGAVQSCQCVGLNLKVCVQNQSKFAIDSTSEI